jgi:hypothetical protein
MKFYGISGIVIKLIRSYPENRYQIVSMKDINPQNGSRPNTEFHRALYWDHYCFLFLTYINDFPLSVKKLANPILFVDDTSIIISNENPEEFKSNISLVLNETITWFNRNFLTLNCDKSHILQFFLKSIGT